MALSTNDAAKIRSTHHTWVGRHPLTVNAVPLNIVATARINQASFAYPIAQVTVDNISADWLTEGKRDRLVLIGTAPGLYDVAVAVLREDVTSTILRFDPRYAGISNWATNIAQLLQDDLFVSIVKFRPSTGHVSSIRKGKFFKRWDDTYSDQGKNPAPLINLGPHQQAWCIGGLARFTINVEPFFWAGRSYAAHDWDADGQTIIEQDEDHLVVDCEPGCHEIALEYIDNKGKVSTAYRYLFANDLTTFLPLNWLYDLTVEGVQTRLGNTFTLTFEGMLEPNTIFPGQLYLMTESPKWGNPVTGIYYTLDDLDDPSAFAHNFVGYALEATPRTGRPAQRGRNGTGAVRTTSLKVESPVTMAKYVPIEKQIIIESKTPANWAEVSKLLSNPIGAFYYLAYHHAPYLINGHDLTYDPFIPNLRRKTHNLDSDVTLGGQLQQLAKLLDGEGNIGSRTDGTTMMMRHPSLQAATTRNQWPNQWNWLEDDLTGELEIPIMFFPSVGRTIAGGFGYNGSSQSQAWRSLAPGMVRSQAGGETTIDDTTVTVAAGQNRVDEIAGLEHARQNARHKMFSFKTNGLIDVAEPCDLDRWHILNIPPGRDPFGEGWTQVRFLPFQVVRKWTGPGTERKTIEITTEPETFGFPGIPLPVNPGAANIWKARPAPRYFESHQIRPPDLGVESIAPVMAWNNVLRLGRTFNFAQPQTHYALMLTDVLFAQINNQKGHFLVPGQPIYTAILTYDEDAGLITLLELTDTNADPLEGGDYTTKNNFTISTRRFFNQAAWLNNTTFNGYQAVVYRNHNGTHVFRSGDDGDTWDAGETFGHSDPLPDANGEARVIPVGAALIANRLVFTAHEGEVGADGQFIYYVFTANNYNGAISRIDNPSGWQVVPHCIVLTSSTNAIVGLYKQAAPEPEDPLDIVTFTPDEDYTHYAITGSGGSSGVFSFAGTHQAFADFDATDGPGGVACNVKVDLTAHYTFNAVTFGYYWSTTTLTGRRGIITLSALDENNNLLESKDFDIEDITPNSIDDPHTFTAEQCGFVGLQVWYLAVSVRLEWEDSSAETVTVFVDNIDIDADLVAYDTDQAIYTLDPTTGTYTRRDSFQLVPFHHFGIAADGSEVMALCRDEDGNQTWLLRSTNSGQTWAKVRRADGFHGLKFAADVTVNGDPTADVVIPFGINRLGISVDGGDILYDALGDWAASMGYVGLIEGVTGVLG